MPSINYTSDQLSQINNLKSYVEDYCETQGIDPTIYTAALDGNTIDPQVLNDPAFQAYWQLAYLRLMELINPTVSQSGAGDVEINYETVRASASTEMDQFVKELLMDSPELMGFFAGQDDDPSTTSQQVINLIRSKSTVLPPPTAVDAATYVDEDARSLGQNLGLSSNMWDWLISTEEGTRTTENHLMGSLADMDQKLASLEEALRGGTISADEFKSKADGISTYRQMHVSLIQNLEDSWGNLLELFSNLLKAQQEGQQALVRNLNA